LYGRRKNHREAQRRYRQTEKGKKAHREAENRRRHGLSQKNPKNMDDPSSTVLPTWVMTPIKAVKRRLFTTGEAVRCHFCGSEGLLVVQFPRRGYG
jgi:ribosomal protein L35